MNITIILLIINVFAAVTVIGLTLIQQSKGDMGSAFGGGGSQSMFGSRGSSNFLTTMTAWMCAIFFLSSLGLAYVYSQRANDDSVVEQSVIQQVNDLPSIVESVESTDAAVNDLPAVVEDAVESTSEEIIEQTTDAVTDLASEANDAAAEIEPTVDTAVEAAEEAAEEVKPAE